VRATCPTDLLLLLLDFITLILFREEHKLTDPTYRSMVHPHSEAEQSS